MTPVAPFDNACFVALDGDAKVPAPLGLHPVKSGAPYPYDAFEANADAVGAYWNASGSLSPEVATALWQRHMDALIRETMDRMNRPPAPPLSLWRRLRLRVAKFIAGDA